MTARNDDHGRYRLVELLGRGGMGEVWRAEDTRLDRPVAIKFLTGGLLEGASRDRFEREAKVAAALTHPNIVAIYDAGDWDDRPYLVLELVSGTTLDRELATHGPLAVERALDAAAQVADGLQAAHAIGVIHRDVKPGNLIRAADGRVKILDFGIARVLDERATRLTRTGLSVGTAAYSAPEQITVGAADERSDLYALGCVLYELLTGRPPFEGDLAAVAYGHVHRVPTPASEHRPGLSPELESLLAVLLAKDPAARPSSAAEVGEWLRRPAIGVEGPSTPPPLPMGPPPLPAANPTVMAGSPAPGSTTPMSTSVLDPGRPTPVGTDGSDGRTGRRGRRWWFGLVAASAVLALLVGAVGYLLGDRTEGTASEEEPRIADTPQPSSTPERSDRPERDSTDARPPWVEEMEREMDRLRDAGEIGSETAEDIRDSINDAIEDNKPEKAREKLEKLREKLEKRTEEWEKQADEWTSELDRLPVPR